MAKAKWVLLILVPLLLAPFLQVSQQPNVQATALTGDDWPMFQHDSAHTGVTTSSGPTKPVKLWSYVEGHFDGFFIGSSAAVVNGIAYVGSNWANNYDKNGNALLGGNIYAFNAYTGAKIWEYPTQSPVYSSPAVYENVVYIGVGTNVAAFNSATGKLIWSFRTAGLVDSSPAVVNGVVYIGSEDDNVYALAAGTGAQIWAYKTGNGVDSSPAVVNGLVYVGSGDGYLYALDAARGGLEWKYNAGRSIESSPCVSSGVVYVCADNSNVTAINALTGAEIWTAQVQPPIEDGLQTSPVTENGLLFISNSYFGLAAFNASSGSVVWSTQGYSFVGSPSVANGTVYVGNVAFNISTGRQLWSFHTGNQINASPAVSNGVYIASQDGNFYAIGRPSGIIYLWPAGTVISIETFWLILFISAITIAFVITVIIKIKKNKIEH